MELQDISEDDIEEIADSSSILARGKRYYRTNRVKSLTQKDGKLIAKVIGSDTYTVEIWIDEDDDIAGECDCPYEGSGCKHIVAVMYKWLDDKENEKENEKESPTLEKIAGGKKQWKLNLSNLHFDLIKDQDKEKLVEAFQWVDKVRIISQDKRSISGEVEGKKVKIMLADYNSHSDLYFKSCSCPSGDGRCEHVLAVFLKLILQANPDEVPADYAEILKKEVKDKKFNRFVSELQGVFDSHTIEPLRAYQFFFSITHEYKDIVFSVKKSQLLKNGKPGQPSAVSEHIFKENKSTLSAKKNKLIELVMMSMQQDPESNYYSNRYNYSYRVTNPTLSKPLNNVFDLEILKAARELYLEEPDAFPDAHFLSDKGSLAFSLQEEEGGYCFKTNVRCGNKEFDLGDKAVTFLPASSDSLWFYRDSKKSDAPDDNKIIFVELHTLHPEQIRKLVPFANTIIKQENIKYFIEHFYTPLSKMAPLFLPQGYEIQETVLAPKPRLFLRDYDFYFSIELRFLYGDKEISYSNDSTILYRNEHNEIVRIKRDTAKERELYHDLINSNAREKDNFFFPANDPLEWLADDSKALIEKGFEIFGQHELVNQHLSNKDIELNIEVSSGIDWFDLHVDAAAGEEEISFDKIISALKNNERFIKLSDGSLAAIPKKWMSRLSGVLGLLKFDKEGLKASRSQVFIVNALVDIAATAKTDQAFEEIRDRFRNFTKIKKVPLPKNLQGTLRDYQVSGYHWLYFLKDFSFGGCLADEMGLGKTVQVLALLLKEKEDSNNKPSLIVVPTSLLFNWKDEVNKFTPSLGIYLHHGQDRLKNISAIKKQNADLIITSYGTLRNDQDLFLKTRFHYIVLDESQQIKNPLADTSKAVCQLNSDHRLVMTGTPIENNSLDLWSQFAFLNPGFLGSMNYFKESFAKKIDHKKDEEKMESLRNMINPFLLLRKKEMVAKDLPEKQVTTLYTEMSPKQQLVYNSWKEKIRMEIKQAIAEEGFMSAKIKILQGLIKLRQISNHPLLIDESYTGDSGKFDQVTQQVEEVLQEGHKVLLFSSFVKMLNLFKDYFEAKGIGCCYLDGSTTKREEVVNEFQNNPDKKVFIISIKAGGLGLNLTAADYVFIVDPWWNPAAEMQAIDRAHRIGQKKNVFVYKIIMKDTIEEKILQLQESKLDLVKNVITTEEGIFKKFGQKDIEKMFE